MKKVFLTGGNRGIGLEFVRQLLARGDHVIATSREKDSAELQELLSKYPQQLKCVALDVTKDSSVAEALKNLSDVSSLDLLINNAGIYLDKNEDVAHLSLATIRDTFEVNTLAPIRLIQALLPQLQKGKATIANITSLMGSLQDNGSGGAYAYRMSKAALNMFVRNLSYDLKENVCLLLHPGWVQTRMGGKSAHITPEESVKGLLSVIDRAKKANSGKFYNYRGDELPW